MPFINSQANLFLLVQVQRMASISTLRTRKMSPSPVHIVDPRVKRKEPQRASERREFEVTNTTCLKALAAPYSTDRVRLVLGTFS